MSAAAVPTLKPQDRHFVNRFSWGHTPALAAQVSAVGGGRAWFERQLDPGAIRDSSGSRVAGWYPYLWHPPREIWANAESGAKPSWELMWELAMWTMMRRVLSTRQLHEVMVDFWSNLLHIPLGDDLAWSYRVAYDAMIRKHALGKFETMLQKAIVHPSMGLYLDNAFSHKDSPNENLGRELLELHTVGIDGGYDEADVLASARMLTGWRVEVWDRVYGVRDFYDPEWHHTGPLTIMGHSAANRDPDGRAATRALLSYLARHPATAARIARRLCVKFVGDEPSADLVRTVKRAWTRSGTDVKATLRALVSHPEFAASAGRKVRMPLEEHLATIRALGIKPGTPAEEHAFTYAAYWRAEAQGQTPYGWPAPDGYPETNQPWSAPGRVLSSFYLHRAYTAWGRYPDARYPAHTSWLPALPATFGTIVDAISRRLLGAPASARTKAAASMRSGIPIDRTLDADDLPDYRVEHLLMTLLGSPAHMTR